VKVHADRSIASRGPKNGQDRGWDQFCETRFGPCGCTQRWHLRVIAERRFGDDNRGSKECVGRKGVGLKSLKGVAIIAILTLAKQAFPGATAPVAETGRVINTSTQYEWSDCEWKVPCPKTTAVIETDKYRYSIRGGGWKGEHPDLFKANDRVIFYYYGPGLAVIVGNKRYLFKVIDREEITATSGEIAQSPEAGRATRADSSLGRRDSDPAHGFSGDSGSPANNGTPADTSQNPDEIDRLVQNGEASRGVVLTVPPGAQVYIDGNKAGLSPVSFVLVKNGDTPHTVTVKLEGFQTVERKINPDGRTIHLELYYVSPYDDDITLSPSSRRLNSSCVIIAGIIIGIAQK
jgi:hypothetical protein